MFDAFTKRDLLVIPISIACLVAASIWRQICIYRPRRSMAIQILRQEWLDAKAQRESWREWHFSDYNFHNPEYEKLWREEIEAENSYLTSIGGGPKPSAEEYLEEKTEFGISRI